MNKPSGPKTSAVSSSSPQYFKKNNKMPNSVSGALEGLQSVRNLRGTGVNKGNLAMTHINPVLTGGPTMNSNSPEVFEDGNVVKIIPLGGTGEVGMNMTALECGDDIIVVDTGFGFGGGEKFPGVDYIVPDTSYLEQNRHKIKGVIFTHGHLDHIGGAPYVLPKLGQVPIFGMPITLALLKNRLSEFEMSDKYTGKLLDPDKPLRLGQFSLQFFRLNHSIPDVIGLAIDTPMGRILYATDWKFDHTPFDGKLSDYGKLAELGDEGVRVLMSDSLGILKPGYAPSEYDIKGAIMKIFERAQGRVLLTTFSTTVARIQHTIDACEKYNRKLAIIGRSMVNNFNVCFKLGYIRVPQGMIVDIKEIDKLPPEQACILSTGSQGEDAAALNRMARDEHPQVKLQGGDSVIFSTKPIPGNEDAVQDLVARLSTKGVDVYKPPEYGLHVSGHASQEELKLLLALTRPRYFLPIHGDHFMLRRMGELGMRMGIPFENNLLVQNNRITELRPSDVVVTDNVVGEGYLLVDGSGVGAVSEVVLEERRQMAKEGTVMLVLLVNKQKKLVSGPEIISRGFVYMKHSGDLFEDIRQEVKAKYSSIKFDPQSKTAWSDLRNGIKNIAKDFILDKTEKEPVIIPVVVQV
jgi:ribonuclease J